MAVVSKEVRELQRELEELKNSFTERLEEIAPGSTRSNVFPISRHELKALAEQAGLTARAYLASKKDQLVDVRDRTEASIQRRPFTTTAVAFAAGAILASLISQSRK